VITAEGAAITQATISGMVLEWEDTSAAITLTRILAERFPVDFAQWTVAALAAISPKALSEADRARFMHDFQGCVPASPCVTADSPTPAQRHDQGQFERGPDRIQQPGSGVSQGEAEGIAGQAENCAGSAVAPQPA
jgi:hypothetical protein